jgi:hypothetical protein
MSRLLIDEQPLMVLPQLAAQIGLNEAIVLQQVHYWTAERRNVVDGRSWTYNTISGWQKQFPFWSSATIRRTIDSLVEKGLLLKRKLSENKFDATLWYSVDTNALHVLDVESDLLKLSTSRSAQNEQFRSAQNEHITSTENTETNTETTGRPSKVAKAAGKFELPDWIPVEQWADFEDLRRKKKKPLTDRARALAVKELEKLRSSGQDVEEVIEQSVLHSWDSFYEVKRSATRGAGVYGRGDDNRPRLVL